MPYKFIAFRRLHPLTAALADAPVDEVRAHNIERAVVAPQAERLERLGLHALSTVVLPPTDESRFAMHEMMGALVVQTSDLRQAIKAYEVLDPEYTVVPNVELTLPTPIAGESYQRLPRSAPEWPEVSGVALAHSLGITGKDVRIGVLDTGIDADHRELRDKITDFRYVPLDSDANAMRDCRGFDVDGHGTHVCDIAAGRINGVAPDAELMVAGVLESETLKTSLERVVVALNWMLAQFKDTENLHKPMIVNMSLGFTRESIDRADFANAVRGFQLVLQTLSTVYSVLPVVAAGNDGVSNVRAPALFDNTLSVGAVDFDLQVPPFSSSGRSVFTNQQEPDLVGYGVDILGAYERNRYGRSLYRRMSGTSMATPYVSGIAALYASQNPRLQGHALWQHLKNMALPLDDAPADRVGSGLARFVQEAG
jgi:subtilisin family serine protease